MLLKYDLDVQQTQLRGGFIEHLSRTLVAQQSVTKITSLVVVNLVTPKAGAKNELVFNKQAYEARLLNKS